ncbi:MAG: toll/interleukin-1 receptor domain-containing protein [Gemmatimonadota bacterium]|nr:toll/interleukin-1 receptor domain-containing protein [Gemmatimonadota bacterium]
MPTVRNKIFLSYRRDDSSGHVGRLHDALARQLGPDAVFMDIDSIAPGADFVQVLHESLQVAAVVVVVIGTRWVGPKPDGTRRVDDENDFVRLEVAKALADPEVRVIPVLVNKAEMLPESSLPEPLRALARRNAMELSDIRWAHDTKMLADEIARTPGDTNARLPLPKSVLVIGAMVMAILLLFIWKPWRSSSSRVDSPVMPNIATELSRIPKAPETKVPNTIVAETRGLLRKVKKEWKADAFVDEIDTDCRSGQCETKVLFVSPEQMLGLTASRANPDNAWQFVNAPGTVRWGADEIPLTVIDLEEAIARSRTSGMVGPILTAALSFARPRGQTLLVWVVVPKVFRNGGQRSYCLDAKTAVQYDCNQLR